MRHAFAGGDIVLTKLGDPLGEACILPDNIQSGVIVADLVRLRLDNPHIDKKWLMYAINSPDAAKQLMHATKGTTRPRVNLSHIRNLKLWVPPYNEQRRMVAKIEELFSELDKGVESLTAAREQLKVYRQAILKHAFEGKLTSNWRRQEGNDWAWRRLAEISHVSGGLTKNPGRNALPKLMKYLRVGNVYADRLDLEEISEIGVTDEEFKKIGLQQGDLLVVEGNGSIDQIGRVAMWDRAMRNIGHQNHLIRVRMNPTMHPRFILFFLLSPLGRESIMKEASSTSGLHTLSISKVSNLVVPAPTTLEEQEKIVDSLETLTSEIDKLTIEVEQTFVRIANVRQSILKKAFSGRLVSQDDDDEPVSTLLARICSDRAGASATTKSIKKRSGGKAA